MNMQTPPVAIKEDHVCGTRQPLFGVCITVRVSPILSTLLAVLESFDYSPGRAFLRGLGSPQLPVAA